MKLTDLDARWSVARYWRDGTEYDPAAGDPIFPGGRHAMGVTFLCPGGCGQRLAVWFVNPMDGGPTLGKIGERPLWHRLGNTFDDLSLAPSIDARDHWHGHVQGGFVTVAGGAARHVATVDELP